MGTLRHECIVVSGWDSKRVLQAHEAAGVIFNEAGMGGLVGGLTQHVINGGAAFLIAPDGSKEGWVHSDVATKARSEFVAWIRDNPELYLDWALILLGGDGDEYAIQDSPAEPKESV